MTAEIIFDPGQSTQRFQFYGVGSANHWRFLADETAIVLVPLCDIFSRPVSAPPLWDRLEAWPCHWGCPDFSQTNPVEFAELKRRFLAGEFPPDDIPMPSPDKREEYWLGFLEQRGEEMLWEKCASDDMKRHWINAYEEITGPGFRLFNFARPDPYQFHHAEPRILRTDLKRIQFRADFFNGKKRQTLYLADCKADLLTMDERRASPCFIGQEEKRLRKQRALAVAETKILAKKRKSAAVEARRFKQNTRETQGRLPWHSEGFRVIYRRNDKGEGEPELTLTPVFRALCQVLSEQPEQRAWFGKIEPLIGPRAKKIDESEGRGTMAESPGRRRLRDLLKERQGQILKKWKVLTVEPAGQRKFLRLSPPK